MKKYISKLHYKKHLNLIDLFLLGIFFPISICYQLVVALRVLAYRLNFFKSYQSNLFTISVGNLTTGGVGKTPLVKEIADYFVSIGEKPAILSRGYGAKLDKKEINIISDGKRIFHNVENSGDEPFWLAKNCKDTAVLTSANRKAIAKYAQDKLKCTKLILDDGYQHLKLKRDLNILVIDYEKRFGNKLLLPAGPLRESLTEISRADKIVVMNKTQNVIEAKSYCDKLSKKHKKPTLLANVEFEKVYSLMTNSEIRRTQKLLAFCAIGQPEQFFSQLKEYGHELGATFIFEDHHSYSLDDVIGLIEQAERKGCKQLITTEKDAVKIKNLIEKNSYIPQKEILVARLSLNLDIEELLQ